MRFFRGNGARVPALPAARITARNFIATDVLPSCRVPTLQSLLSDPPPVDKKVYPARLTEQTFLTGQELMLTY